MEESDKVNEGVGTTTLPPAPSAKPPEQQDIGYVAKEEHEISVTNHDIGGAVGNGGHGNMDGQGNMDMNHDGSVYHHHPVPQNGPEVMQGQHQHGDVKQEMASGQEMNQIMAGTSNELSGTPPNTQMTEPPNAAAAPIDTGMASQNGTAHQSAAAPHNTMVPQSIMVPQGVVAPQNENVPQGVMALENENVPQGVMNPRNLNMQQHDMANNHATATEADIAAIAGEAAVAAVDAGEPGASNAQLQSDQKKPEGEEMKHGALDMVTGMPKLEGEMHHDHGEMPHDMNDMSLSPGMVPRNPNVRSISDAGLDSNEKAAKRARRKTEPIKPFNDMLYELMAFRAREGHCRVPVDNKSALGRWVASLRSQYSSLQKGYPTADLTEERLIILRSIDFIWDLQQFDSDARWKRQFEELVQYKRENGHCNAPQSTPLGKWVKMQRENYRETQLRAQGALPQNRTKPRPTLSEDRIAQLNSIGFQWKVAPPAAGWEHRFDELVEYKRLHGDCNVPQAWPENRQLGRWVMKQRCQYTLRQKGDRCQITDERIQRLNDLGFSWTAPSFRKNKKGEGEKEFDIRPKWL